MNVSRIPVMKGNDLAAMRQWFSDLYDAGLLFHPEDDPADIVNIQSGEAMFSADEVPQLQQQMDAMFAQHGDNVCEAAYPFFMHAFHGDRELL